MAATISWTAAACAAVSIDYVDFIQRGDIQYVATFEPAGRALTEADLGAVEFRVRQTLSRSGGGGPPRDGDAAFVPAGDPVYAVRGYASTFRLAARHDGRLVRYEADTNPAANRGGDLLDIEGKVASIALLDARDGRTVQTRLTDAARVRDLVRLVVDAPIERSAAAPTGPPGRSVFVAFELADGTASARRYQIERGVLGRGVQVAGPFRAAVEELVAAAPTPTPLPATLNLARRYDLGQAVRLTIKELRANGPGLRQADVATFAALLDADLVTAPAAQLPPEYVVVIFEFATRYVSLAYDASSDRLTVVAPDDRIAVRAPPGFAALLAR